MRYRIDECIAAYNAMDVPRMLRTLHPKVSVCNIAGGGVTDQADGIDAFEGQTMELRQRFRSRQQRVTAFARQGHRVTAEVAISAGLAQPLGEGPPAGTTWTGQTEIGPGPGLFRRLSNAI